MPFVEWEGASTGAGAVREDTLDWGLLPALPFERFAASMALEFIAPRAERAVDELFLEIATPRASFSCSSMGSLLTNSLFSNWMTTWGRECREETLRARACMSFTCNWPLAVLAEGCW